MCPAPRNSESIPFPLWCGDRTFIEVTFCRVQTQGLFLAPPKKAWSGLKIMMTQHLEASVMSCCPRTPSLPTGCRASKKQAPSSPSEENRYFTRRKRKLGHVGHRQNVPSMHRLSLCLGLLVEEEATAKVKGSSCPLPPSLIGCPFKTSPVRRDNNADYTRGGPEKSCPQVTTAAHGKGWVHAETLV